MYTCYIQSFKILASFCSWTGWFESYLVKNPRRHVFAWCGSFDDCILFLKLDFCIIFHFGLYALLKLRQRNQNSCVYCNMSRKNWWVGWDFILFIYFFFQLKCMFGCHYASPAKILIKKKKVKKAEIPDCIWELCTFDVLSPVFVINF